MPAVICPELRVIGIRHEEKMVKASDEGDYFRVPLDARSLQYELYFDEGSGSVQRDNDYTSANTTRLNVDQTKELLLKLPEIQRLVGVQ